MYAKALKLGFVALAMAVGFSAFSGTAQAQYPGYGGCYSGNGFSIGFGRGTGSPYAAGYASGYGRGYSGYAAYPVAPRTYYRAPVYHDTTHYDYHPGEHVRHGNHYHYQPGHYDLHRSGHWHD